MNDLIGILVWLAWGISIAWLAYLLGREWRNFLCNKDDLNPPPCPDFKTFLFVEYMTLGNVLMRLYVDQKNFYPKQGGFLGTGLTQPQWLCLAAWVFALLYLGRWAVMFLISAEAPVVKWSILAVFLIFAALGSSAVISWVMNVPLQAPVGKVI
jgi:hypothetical protein